MGVGEEEVGEEGGIKMGVFNNVIDLRKEWTPYWRRLQNQYNKG